MTVEALPGSLRADVATQSAIAERRMRYRVLRASAAAVLSIVVVASTYRRVRQPEA